MKNFDIADKIESEGGKDNKCKGDLYRESSYRR